MKRIKVNGAAREIPEGWSLQQLQVELGFADKPVVMELNRQAIHPRDFSQTLIPAEAEIEVIVLAAGG
jgi:thiamine biosynthesis protein ThiS